MFEFFEALWDFVVNSIDFLSSSFTNGLQFFMSLFVNIPNLLFEVLDHLPDFIQVGITGTFGFIALVVFLKLLALLKLS